RRLPAGRSEVLEEGRAVGVGTEPEVPEGYFSLGHKFIKTDVVYYCIPPVDEVLKFTPCEARVPCAERDMAGSAGLGDYVEIERLRTAPTGRHIIFVLNRRVACVPPVNQVFDTWLRDTELRVVAIGLAAFDHQVLKLEGSLLRV